MCSFIISSLQRLPFCSFMRCLVTRGFLLSVFSFLSAQSFATHSEPTASDPRACSATIDVARTACSARVTDILNFGSASGDATAITSLHANFCPVGDPPGYQRIRNVCDSYVQDCTFHDPSFACTLHTGYQEWHAFTALQISLNPAYGCDAEPDPGVPNRRRAPCGFGETAIFQFTVSACNDRIYETTYPYVPNCTLAAHDDTAAAESADRAENAADEAERSADEADQDANSAAASASSSRAARNASQAARDDAEAAANEAEGSATDADASASDAADSADTAEARADEAIDASDDAAGSKDAAAGSATEASGSADDAEGSATEASGSADDAEGSATEAEASKTAAESAKEAAESAKQAAEAAKAAAESSSSEVTVNVGVTAGYWADVYAWLQTILGLVERAEDAADDSEDSAEESETSATEADASADDAEAAKVAARQSEVLSGQWADDAEAAAAAADASADEAETSATEADASATDAEAAKVAARVSEDSAQADATESFEIWQDTLVLRNEADTSATEASGSADDAEAAADESDASATDAEASAEAAEASADDATDEADRADRRAIFAQEKVAEARVVLQDTRALRDDADGSAAAAETSATEASGSADDAEASADESDVSADEAEASADDADASATEAEESADEAETAAGESTTAKVLAVAARVLAESAAVSAQQSASDTSAAQSALPGIFQAIFSADVIPLLSSIKDNTRSNSLSSEGIWDIFKALRSGDKLSVEDTVLHDILNDVINGSDEIDVNDAGTQAILLTIEGILDALRDYSITCQYVEDAPNISESTDWGIWEQPLPEVEGEDDDCNTTPADMKQARIRLEQVAYILLKDTGKLDDIKDILDDVRGACHKYLGSFASDSDGIVDDTFSVDTDINSTCDKWKGEIGALLERAKEQSSLLRRLLESDDDIEDLLGSILGVQEDLQTVLGDGGVLDDFLGNYFGSCDSAADGAISGSDGPACHDYDSHGDIAYEAHQDMIENNDLLNDIEHSVGVGQMTGDAMRRKLNSGNYTNAQADALLASYGCRFTGIYVSGDSDSAIICPADLDQVAQRSQISADELEAWGLIHEYDFCGTEYYIVVEYGCDTSGSTVNGTCSVDCPDSAETAILGKVFDQTAEDNATIIGLLEEIRDQRDESKDVLDDIHERQDDLYDYATHEPAGPSDDELDSMGDLAGDVDVDGGFTDARAGADGFGDGVSRSCPVIPTVVLTNYNLSFASFNTVFCNFLLAMRTMLYAFSAVISAFVFFRSF